MRPEQANKRKYYQIDRNVYRETRKNKQTIKNKVIMAFKDVDFQKAYAILELGRISEREGTDKMTDILKVQMIHELHKVINKIK